jgi:hypothetical protein
MRDAIVVGSQKDFFSYLPQTAAREEAEQRLADQQQQAQEIERKQAEVRACAAQILTDGITRLAHRLDREEQYRAEQARIKAEQAEREEQRQIDAMLAQGPDPDQPYAFDQKEREASSVAGDDGDLTVKHEMDPEHYGPNEREDQDPEVKPALSYGRVPLSYVKKKDAEGDLPEGVERRSPPPLGNYPIYDPAELGKPEDPKQVPQPISFNQ